MEESIRDAIEFIVGLPTEFTAALAGAAIGGLVTFWASSSQTKKVLRHERDMVRQATARETALLMLESLARLHTSLGNIGTAQAPLSPQAVEALNEINRLNSSRAPLLPDELARLWHEFAVLLYNFRDLLTGPERHEWPEAKLQRASQDVRGYVAYVRRCMATYIRDSSVTPELRPPDLRRDNLTAWDDHKA